MNERIPIKDFLENLIADKVTIDEKEDMWQFYDDKMYGTVVCVSKDMFPTLELAKADAINSIKENIEKLGWK